ncbi:MAG: MFS transporter, partial [Pseudomonadota bacterium]
IEVIQGAAAVTMVLNVIALWKQEPRNRALTDVKTPRMPFREAWRAYREDNRSGRLLIAVALGTIGFSMQDVLLEPYGGEVLGLSVSQTTMLTALFAVGTLIGFAIAARLMGRGKDPHRVAAYGTLVGVAAFTCVIFASPLESANLFRLGTALIGTGGGLFAVGTLTACMALAKADETGAGSGLALGAWGAVQASAVGVGLAGGGAIRDIFSGLAASFGPNSALADAAFGYSVVYHLEVAFLFVALVAIGPLVRTISPPTPTKHEKIGLAQLPG